MKDEPSARHYLISALFLMLVGWGGLALLIFLFNVPPFVWARWAFFVFWFIALAGTALPLTYFLNVRFPTKPPAEPAAIVRQSLWVGVFGATLAWLQLGQIVTLWVWVGLGGGLIAIEYLIRSRERARWRPPDVPMDNPKAEAHFVDAGLPGTAEGHEQPE